MTLSYLGSSVLSRIAFLMIYPGSEKISILDGCLLLLHHLRPAYSNVLLGQQAARFLARDRDVVRLGEGRRPSVVTLIFLLKLGLFHRL